MSKEEEIKKYCIEKYDADMVGITSVEAINKYAPAGHRPDDYLIDAKSVIVVGRPGAMKGAFRSPVHTAHVANRSFGVDVRKSVTLDLAQFIEQEYGYYSVSSGVNLSDKLCAELAGLGTRCMAAGIILNNDFSLINIATTVTTMPLKADAPLKEPVCPHPSCVKSWEREGTTPCLETCPECLSGELENGKIKWMRYNRHLCATRAQTTSMGSFTRTLLEAMNEPDPEKRKMIIMGTFFRRSLGSLVSGLSMGQCGECLRACPVSLRVRTLHPKPKPGNLSRVREEAPIGAQNK